MTAVRQTNVGGFAFGIAYAADQAGGGVEEGLRAMAERVGAAGSFAEAGVAEIRFSSERIDDGTHLPISRVMHLDDAAVGIDAFHQTPETGFAFEAVGGGAA